MISFNKRFGWLFIFSFVGFGFGFGNQLVVSFYFGTNSSLDFYWTFLAISNFFLFYVQPLREALVPAVFKANSHSQKKASEIFFAGVFLQIFLAFFSIIFLIVFSGKISAEIVDGNNLKIWFIPYFLCFAIAETFNGLLLAFDKVLYHAIARLISAVVGLISLFFLIPVVGVAALVLSLVISQLIMLGVSAIVLYRENIRFAWSGFSILKKTSNFFPMFFSLLTSYFFAQLYVFVERFTMQEMGSGLVSSFQYSVVLVNVGMNLLIYPVVNIIWPKLLAKNLKEDVIGLFDIVNKALFPLCFVLFFGCVFVYWYANEIVQIIYMRGKFDPLAVFDTGHALKATIFTALPIAIYTVLTRLLLTQGYAKLLVSVALTISLSGMVIIFVAFKMNSIELMRWHWFLANSIGAMSVIILTLVRSHYKKSDIFMGILWIFKAIFIVIVPLLFIPAISSDEGKIFLIFDVFVRFIFYSLVVIFLAHFSNVIRFDIKLFKS